MNEIIYLDNAIHELTDTENPVGRQIDMFYSELDPYWTRKGEISTSIVDTGNGIVFHDHNNGETIELDYAQVFYLNTALKRLGYSDLIG